MRHMLCAVPCRAVPCCGVGCCMVKVPRLTHLARGPQSPSAAHAGSCLHQQGCPPACIVSNTRNRYTGSSRAAAAAATASQAYMHAPYTHHHIAAAVCGCHRDQPSCDVAVYACFCADNSSKTTTVCHLQQWVSLTSRAAAQVHASPCHDVAPQGHLEHCISRQGIDGVTRPAHVCQGHGNELT